MASMSCTTSTSLPKGFSVLQPTLGAPLSWMPAVGTAELEQLINAYLPGPASAQEKRAAISMDFFEHSAQTGENFKYYPVNAASHSPASSSSAYNTSPAMSDLSYYSSPSQSSTPSASAASMARRSSQKSSAAAAAKGVERTDFSHLPGMKIMTTTGEDVTNSASRGCKTKEQREHAHLMRVLKACDACKKKKIRCDPSHKRRSAPQARSAKPESATKLTKKARKSPATTSTQSAASLFTPAPEPSFDLDMMADLTGSSLDQSWDEFLSFNDEPINATISQDFYGAVPQDLDFFFLGGDNQFSPADSGSSGFTNSPAVPLTPVATTLIPHSDLIAFNGNSLYAQAGDQEPTLPYLNDGAHGSNYVDFNLYSPSSSFVDEEPQKLKAGDKRKASAIQNASAESRYTGPIASSPAGLNESQSSISLRDGQQWYIDHSRPTAILPTGLEWEGSGAGEQHGGTLSVDLLDDGSFTQRPWHANDGGHGDARAVKTAAAAAARSHGLSLQQQQVASNHSPATSSSPGEDTATSAAATTVASSPQSPRTARPQVVVQQRDITSFRGVARVSPRTVSPTELNASVNRLTPRLRNKPSSNIPLSTAPSSPETLRRPRVDGLLPAGELHNLQVLEAKSSPVSRGQTARARGHSTQRASTALPCQICDLSVRAYRCEVSRHSLGPQHPRQTLHGKILNAASSSQSPRRPSEGTISPVRQLVGHSSSMAQLVAFGLVIMTLSIVVGFTSLLQSLQTPSSHLFTVELEQYLLAPRSAAVLLVVLPTLVSSVSGTSRLDTPLNAQSKVRSSAGTSLRRALRGTSARISLACI